ncbi:hypothetical protein EYF80_040150 [Liparis tanakae]|uniref:Uncharacterized protein n=1 Tax=Liparis tanakae TaxID=230148 RepID=A0A4Z2G9K2_9TELE|nr:hypothetical protein EYF80_040150 [Liparis tanakae]
MSAADLLESRGGGPLHLLCFLRAVKEGWRDGGKEGWRDGFLTSPAHAVLNVQTQSSSPRVARPTVHGLFRCYPPGPLSSPRPAVIPPARFHTRFRENCINRMSGRSQPAVRQPPLCVHHLVSQSQPAGSSLQAAAALFVSFLPLPSLGPYLLSPPPPPSSSPPSSLKSHSTL